MRELVGERSLRISAVLTGLFPESVSDADECVKGIACAAEAGFDAVEFFYDGPDNSRVREALVKAGIASIYHPAYPMKRLKHDLGNPDEGGRRTALDFACRMLERARMFGSDTVMFLSGPEREHENERSQVYAYLTESLKSLCEFAVGRTGESSLEIHLEAFNNLGEPWLFVGPTSRCLRLAEAVAGNCANFGITLDLSHILQMGENPVDSMLSMRKFCSHVHLANCVIRDRADPLFGDKHPAFGHPASEVDSAYLKRFLAELRRGGFFRDRTVTLGLEIITRPPSEPAATLRAAKQTIDPILDLEFEK